MSNQIVITSGAKVRNLDGVLTGTSGIVGSVGFGTANGVATLDSSGKVPLSQLPASVITYLGTWNAATNTPTLTNGVGDVGDLYICNVAGTVNFGAGPITFAVGDWVIYSGTTWEKSGGASGTVTSVAMTVPTGLSVTGSPITTSGTLAVSLASGYTIPTTSFLQGLVPYTGATSNVNLGEYGISGGYLGLDTTPTSTPTSVGTLSWDSTYLTPKVVTGTGATTLQIGQEEVILVHNNTGSTLVDGQVVYVTGSTGELPSVSLADASSETTSAATLGVVTETIANGANGFITVSGLVHGLNTLAYTEGDILWLSETAGEFTNVKPISPAHLVLIGYVIKKAGGNGSILVKIQNTQELAECSDVLFTSLANNDILAYESSTDLWKNKTIANVLGYTPANAATYVPYTGATSNVDLGIYNLIANNRIVGSAGSGGSAYSNTIFVSSTSITSGYENTIIGWGVGSLLTTGYYNTAVGGESLALITTGNDNTAFGGYALSTATGSYNTGIGSGAGRLIGSGSYNTIIGGYNGTSGMSSNVILSDGAGNIRYRFDGTNNNFYQNVNFGSTLGNGTYTYTLPSASGTLALTSDIPSLTNYVTLNGNQTITGIKTFTNEQLFGNGITLTGGYITYTSGSFNLTLNTNILTANRNVFLQDGSGTLAFTSDIPSLSGYVQGSGTTNYLSKFTASGTIGNSLVYDNGTTVAIGSTAYSGGAKLITYQTSSNTAECGIISYTTAGAMAYLADVTTGDIFRGDSTIASVKSTKFRVTNAGAATFSSSVTTNGDLTVSATQPNSYLTYTDATSYARMLFYESATYKGVIQFMGSSFVTTSRRNALEIINGTTGDIAMGSGDTRTFYIKNGGNVGIGTSSPGYRLDTYTSNQYIGRFDTSDATGGFVAISKSNTAYGYLGSAYHIVSGPGSANDMAVAATSNLIFSTGGSLNERMRITSGGYTKFSNNGSYQYLASSFFEVNQSAADWTQVNVNKITSGTPLGIYIGYTSLTPNNTSSQFLACADSTNDKFIVYSTGSVVNRTGSYGTISDIKYKENIIDATPKLADIMELRVRNFNMIGDNTKQIGFIAQEFEEVFPAMVDTSIDRESGDEYKSIKTTVLIPMLVKAIQEQQEIINNLSAKVTALEQKA